MDRGDGIVTHRDGISLCEVTAMSFKPIVSSGGDSLPVSRSPSGQTELCGADHVLVTMGVNLVVAPHH